MQPEAMIAEPCVMGWCHRGYGVGARGYGMVYEPESMTGVRGGARVYGVRARVYDRSCGWSVYGVRARVYDR